MATSRWEAGGDTFTKQGMTFPDHHYMVDGKSESSPPSKLKTLYDYLPTEELETSDKHVPNKVTMAEAPEAHGEMEAARMPGALKAQAHCLGVYELLRGQAANGQPMWKHVSQDLVLALGDDEWVIAHFQTFMKKKRICMRHAGSKFPFSGKGSGWQEWDGRAWIETNVKSRASQHGWGLEGGDEWCYNTESSLHDARPKGRSPPKQREKAVVPGAT